MESVCCAICLDSVKNEASLSPCQHLFCYECIHFWSNRSNVCPCCRSRFTKIVQTSSGKKKKKITKVKNQDFQPDEDEEEILYYLDDEFNSEDEEDFIDDLDDYGNVEGLIDYRNDYFIVSDDDTFDLGDVTESDEEWKDDDIEEIDSDSDYSPEDEDEVIIID
eukprot:gene6895-11057_t